MFEGVFLRGRSFTVEMSLAMNTLYSDELIILLKHRPFLSPHTNTSMFSCSLLPIGVHVYFLHFNAV